MKICYIISTCDKYLDTRVKYQMDTFLKAVPTEDIYYLTSKPNLEKRQFGWNCMDDSQNITWKYIHFMYNTNIPEYDWYIFIDDDTFVFQQKLENLLQQFNCNDYYYIGKELDHIKKEFCLYMSGGAGYAISKALYAKIYDYLHNIGINEAYYFILNLKEQFCDDLWIRDIEKRHGIHVKQLNHDGFHIESHKNETELADAITFHKVTTADQYEFYQGLNTYQNPIIVEKLDTTFALVSDNAYFQKAKKTIVDLRSRGNWQGDIVLITIDFDLNANFKDFYNITEVKFLKIDKTSLLEKIGPNGFSNSDKREINKVNQWEKIHVFDDYFKRWQRVVFLDAGLRVLEDVSHLLCLDYTGKILAPRDGKISEYNWFETQLSYDNQDYIKSLVSHFGDNILTSEFMLNCIWIYDTSILELCDKKQLIEAMNAYPICKTNEMGIMNLLFHFKYHLWEPFPIKSATNGKYLFDWCELNNPGTNWREYCYIKYPVTITFEDT